MSNYVIYEGTTVRFYTSTPFSTFSGIAVDPDTVTFSYSIQHNEAQTFTYTHGSGDPTGKIVRDGVGLYHADIDTTGNAGTWVYSWSCAPSAAVNYDATRTKVTMESTPLVISSTAISAS